MRRWRLIIAGAVAVGSTASFCCSADVTNPGDVAGEGRQSGAEIVRPTFLQRLRRVADVANLFEQETVGEILDLKLEASVTEREPVLSCAAHFHTSTVTVKGTSWYHALPSGVGHIQVPAFTINPATVSRDPELTYQILHYEYCETWPRLQDGSEATLTFNGLPAFTCLTPSAIRAVIPEAQLIMATDGVYLVQYQGRLNDDSGTTLTFNFRTGAGCALAAEVRQDQEEGLRYRRAMYKHEACREGADREFCAVHPNVAWSDSKGLEEMKENVTKKCGTINSNYVQEPSTGAAALPLPERHRRWPCDAL